MFILNKEYPECSNCEEVNVRNVVFYGKVTYMRQIRKTQIFHIGKWTDFPFYAIREGTIYRLFKPNGEPVIDHKNEGITIFEAITDAYFSEELEEWIIDYIPYRGEL